MKVGDQVKIVTDFKNKDEVIPAGMNGEIISISTSKETFPISVRFGFKELDWHVFRESELEVISNE
jgi:hypothetical protein